MTSELRIDDTVRLSWAFLQTLALDIGLEAPTSVGSFARGTVTSPDLSTKSGEPRL